MKVTLIDHTRFAVQKLIFTKNTRLQMSPGGLDDVFNMSEDHKMEQLKYIAGTIKSSWEFVNYTFLIEGVTRAFTHQLVRNRQGSYAQQTMRILDQKEFGYETGKTITDGYSDDLYTGHMGNTQLVYDELIEKGASIEDARGVLPTNIHTNIVAQYNLRTMSDIIAARSSPRTQGEYRAVLDGMYEAIIGVHPWAKMFLKDRKVKAAKELDQYIDYTASTEAEKLDMIKLVDILRN